MQGYNATGLFHYIFDGQGGLHGRGVFGAPLALGLHGGLPDSFLILGNRIRPERTSSCVEVFVAWRGGGRGVGGKNRTDRILIKHRTPGCRNTLGSPEFWIRYAPTGDETVVQRVGGRRYCRPTSWGMGARQ